jgi:hypothetical protein
LHFFSKKVINVALLTCMMYVPMFYINKSNYFNYNNTNRVAHRVTHGHRLMPMPDPQLIGLPMGRAHGRTSRPIPYPFGSGAHGRTCPWVKLPGLTALLSPDVVSTRSTCVRMIASIERSGARRTQRMILRVIGSIFLQRFEYKNATSRCKQLG